MAINFTLKELRQNNINQFVTYDGGIIDGKRVIEESSLTKRCIAFIPKQYEGNIEYEKMMREKMKYEIKK